MFQRGLTVARGATTSGRPTCPGEYRCFGTVQPMTSGPGASELTAAAHTPWEPPWSARLDLLMVALVGILLRIPALTASRHLTFDDGVYGASAVAMRDGAQPFRDVFSSQAPLHLPLVRLADLAGAQAHQSPRLLAVVGGIAAGCLTVLVARTFVSRSHSLLAGLLVVVSGSFVWVSSALHADPAAIAFGLGALLCALRFVDTPSWGRALAIGVLIGAAISTKSMAVTFAAPIGLLLWESRRWAMASAAVVASAIVGVAAAAPFGFDAVIDQAFTYHADAATHREPVRNLSRVVSTMVDRDPVLVALFAVAIGTWLLSRRSGPISALPADAPPARSGRILWAWMAFSLALLAYIHPMWRPHLSHLIVPSALLVVRHLRSLRLTLACVVLLLPLQLHAVASVVWPGPYQPAESAIVRELRALPPAAYAISDEPGLVWSSRRRTPADLVDTSALRVDTGRITEDSLLRDAASPQVCAVVVTSSRFGRFEGLTPGLASRDYREVPLPTSAALPRLFVRSGGLCGDSVG